MNTQTLILAILNFGDATGYEIKKNSSEGAFSFFVDISYGTIYPTLSRLEDEGFVLGRSETQTGKPDKKIFSITDKGREEFVRMLDSQPQKDKFKSEFLLTAMSATICKRDVVERAVEKQIADTEEILSIINDMSEQCQDPASQWVTDFGKHVKTAALEYLNNNKSELIEMAETGLHLKQAAE